MKKICILLVLCSLLMGCGQVAESTTISPLPSGTVNTGSTGSTSDSTTSENTTTSQNQ